MLWPPWGYLRVPPYPKFFIRWKSTCVPILVLLSKVHNWLHILSLAAALHVYWKFTLVQISAKLRNKLMILLLMINELRFFIWPEWTLLILHKNCYYVDHHRMLDTFPANNLVTFTATRTIVHYSFPSVSDWFIEALTCWGEDCQ